MLTPMWRPAPATVREPLAAAARVAEEVARGQSGEEADAEEGPGERRAVPSHQEQPVPPAVEGLERGILSAGACRADVEDAGMRLVEQPEAAGAGPEAEVG